jgi:hypothetical protein
MAKVLQFNSQRSAATNSLSTPEGLRGKVIELKKHQSVKDSKTIENQKVRRSNCFNGVHWMFSAAGTDETSNV